VSSEEDAVSEIAAPDLTSEGTVRYLPIVNAAPVADAERHDLDGGQIVIDGNVLVV
jgi:hypothetical protein